MRVHETTAQSMLVASSLPDADYVVNPYTGCAFACQYCYASFMGRFVGEPVTEWGRYLYVKTNAVEVVKRELAAWKPARKQSSLFLSSVTDPYQGVEARYRLTRGILEALADDAYPGVVSLLTKSGMIKRDIDVLARLPRADVGMTVTTTDDALGRFMEVKAPAASVRLKTLALLVDAGLPVYAFVGPLFPHYRYNPGGLSKLFEALAHAGVREIYAEHINCKPYILERLAPALAHESENVRAVYAGATTDEHRRVLTDMVMELVAKHGFKLRLGEVIYHGQTARGREKAA